MSLPHVLHTLNCCCVLTLEAAVSVDHPTVAEILKYPSVFQELPKYLRGYHVSTKEEMVNIAAMLFRIKVNNDKNQLVMIPKMLKELVPADQLKAMSENEWKKVLNHFIPFDMSSFNGWKLKGKEWCYS